MNCQSYDVANSEDASADYDPPAETAYAVVKERKKNPDSTSQTEQQDAQDFSVNENDLGGNELECLKHEHEIPLRLYASWGW